MPATERARSRPLQRKKSSPDCGRGVSDPSSFPRICRIVYVFDGAIGGIGSRQKVEEGGLPQSKNRSEERGAQIGPARNVRCRKAKIAALARILATETHKSLPRSRKSMLEIKFAFCGNQFWQSKIEFSMPLNENSISINEKSISEIEFRLSINENLISRNALPIL